jgi:hypothetical protein
LTGTAPDGSQVFPVLPDEHFCQPIPGTPPTGKVTTSGTNVATGYGTGRFEGPICNTTSFTTTVDFDTTPWSYVSDHQVLSHTC